MVAGWCNKYDYNSNFNKPYGVKNQSRTKGHKMRTLLILLMLSACQPVEFGGYNIIQGWKGCNQDGIQK